MSIYVISDLHGEYDLFIQMLEKINFKESDKLIILGDVLDRGLKPIDILSYIMDKPNIELIMGNHEEMFIDYMSYDDYYRAINRDIYLLNGGATTLNQYEELSNEIKIQLRRYLIKLEKYKLVETKLGKFILVHSGLNLTGIRNYDDMNKVMEIQSDSDLLWSREEFYMFPGVPDYTIIFGHTPTKYLYEFSNPNFEGSFDIWYDPNFADKIGIDCGATFGEYGGKLSCLRLDDMAEFYL